MKIGTKIYTIYGWLTIRGKRYSPIGNRVIWFGVNENGRTVDVKESDITEEPQIDHEKIAKEKTEKEDKAEIIGNLQSLANKEFSVDVKNFPKQDTLVKAVESVKKEVAKIKTKVTVENDMTPVADTVRGINDWQEAILDAIKNIPEPEKQHDYTKNIEKVAKSIEEKDVDLSVVVKLLSSIKDKDSSVDLSKLEKGILKLDKILKNIEKIEPFKLPEGLIHKGHLRVTPDRVGGGGGGLTKSEAEALLSLESNQNPLSAYNTAGMDVTASPYYFGYLKIDGCWYIKKLDTTSGSTYTKGDEDYDTAWEDRVTLTYGEFNAIF